MKQNDYFYRKLHSLMGVVPIGGYLFFHLIANYYATKGPEAYNRMVEWIEGLPFLIFLEIFLIYIPILFHAIYGLYMAFQSTNNVGNYGYFRNVMFVMQRITGMIAFVFIAWHVYETRIQKALGAEVSFDMMADILTNPWMFAFYTVGIIATIFHFSNGMWSFLVSWGITVGPGSQRISTYVWMTVFFILSAIALRTLFAFI